jgi:hypothetical protein
MLEAQWPFSVCVLLLGCASTPEGSTHPVGVESAGTSTSMSPDKIEIGASGPIELPASWKTCATSDDCEMVAYGCCTKVSSNRSHADSVRSALQHSSREYCAVKSACGRGKDGTADGEPAECFNGRCATPIELPDGATRCSADDDCVVAMLDCCNKVAVGKAFEKQAQQVMMDIELDRPMCPPSASCQDPPPTCAAGRCQRSVAR